MLKLVALLLVLGLLLAARFPSLGANFDEFTVMTFNLRNSAMRDRGERSWASRRKVAIATIRGQAPDVVGFQEVSPRQRADLEEGLVGYHSRGTGRDGGGRGEQCPIFWKMERRALDSGTFWLSPTPQRPSRGWDARMRRICTWVSFEGLTVFNTHLDFAGRESRRQALRLIDRRARGSVVVMGDFNERPGSPTLESLGLIDAYDVIHPDSREFTTFHSFQGTERKVGPRLDYIMVSPDLEVVNAEIVQSVASRLPSDHAAVVARLRKKR